MRIIAGRFRRRRLASAPGNTTRPITDRVKEHLFQLLGPFDGEHVLDVFAGTGTMGLEAMSRGAESVVFVEKDHRAYELLCQNVAALGLDREAFCWRADVYRCSFHPKGREDLLPYDRIFFDPPYAIAHEIQPPTPLFKALERLGKPNVTSAHVELILRVPVRQEITLPTVWKCDDVLKMSSMALYRLSRADGDAGLRGSGEADPSEEE